MAMDNPFFCRISLYLLLEIVYWANTKVFVDVDDCPIPNGLDTRELLVNIKTSLENQGYFGRVTVNFYGRRDRTECITQLLDVNIFNTFPGTIAQRRTRIFIDLLYRATETYKPQNFLIIMGDISNHKGFLKSIHKLKSKRRFNFLLAQPHKASEELHDAVSTEWLWESLTAGGGPINNLSESAQQF
ncbi:hypothetical protein ARALYDRAFT_906317 [Arabidopsis lyrata subsp. lyrata]|uniref:NYN domain-containing protein n=1 Tax=Arabidopsis lyrata subsp. lyrata TaxID=81972 RepID=D7LT09_ARALL|nr:hypothetical protein ARALYDRAFT_906317 [Arabidopsis lyrata subsp. lyrata]